MRCNYIGAQWGVLVGLPALMNSWAEPFLAHCLRDSREGTLLRTYLQHCLLSTDSIPVASGAAPAVVRAKAPWGIFWVHYRWWRRMRSTAAGQAGHIRSSVLAPGARCRLVRSEVHVLLYDLTITYFQSRRHGRQKDKRRSLA